jgi:hypothetical protein
MTNVNRTTQQISDQTLLTGIQGNPQQFPLLVVDGKAATVSDAIAILQARIDSTNRVGPARTALQAAVKAERDEHATSHAFVTELRRALQSAFADAPDTLGKYGLKPRKAPAVSVRTRVLALAKATATRAARHTMGSKQKQALKGDVIDVTVAPVTASGASPADASALATAPASPPAASSPSLTAPAKQG